MKAVEIGIYLTVVVIVGILALVVISDTPDVADLTVKDGYDMCDTSDPRDSDGRKKDRNDNTNAINPGKSENCGNGVDENCDPIDDACASVGKYRSGDLISVHHDHAADPDDGLAAPAVKTVLGEFGITQVVVVTGAASPLQANYVVASEKVMDATWGKGKYYNAHKNWGSSVNAVAAKWAAVLNKGKSVWIVEAGPSDFTADVLRRVKKLTSANTNQMVKVVQHSKWNEDYTTPADLKYVKRQSGYIKIDDGNGDNGNADLSQPYSTSFKSKAKNDPKYGPAWKSGFKYYDDRKLKDVIDFSDIVELLYILGVPKSKVAGIADFADEYFSSGSTDNMIFPGTNWVSATPESQGVDSAKLQQAMNYMQNNFPGSGAKRAVVIRNGRLIWKGAEAGKQQHIYSAAKTFTSTVLGLNVGKGKVNLNAHVTDYLPSIDNKYSQYSRLRVKHLATMTGGYDGKNLCKQACQCSHSSCESHLDPAIPDYSPGTRWLYHDPNVEKLAEILMREGGASLSDQFKKGVANKIGLKNWNWFTEITACTINGIRFNEPTGYCKKGMHISALDFVRYGHLYLNKGNWDGTQVLSTSFVNKATTVQVPKSTPCPAKYCWAGQYGYYWYVNGVGKKGRRWPHAPPKTFWAQGLHCQYVVVIPEWNIVIAKLNLKDDGKVSKDDGLWDEFFRRLSPGVTVKRIGVIPAGSISVTGKKRGQKRAQLCA
jgi:CubicO group peptidase (beta-lactamase class C family)